MADAAVRRQLLAELTVWSSRLNLLFRASPWPSCPSSSSGDARSRSGVDRIDHTCRTRTLVDMEVSGGALVVTQTEVYPPGSPTLSGVVTEMTSAAPVAVSGTHVGRVEETGGGAPRPTAPGSTRYQGCMTAGGSRGGQGGLRGGTPPGVFCQRRYAFDMQLRRR